ncbi:iron ABC transporter permease [Pseudonocardia sp.]|uniref:ABC transporter permease n=1 Tax=Pseudonocardia sp. TaxID=60912 RepID=UPI0026218AD4|nr:iron ABC transporter permease [Pseudonocardia sp.]
MAGVLVALGVAGPLVVLPASFLAGGGGFDPIALALLPSALLRSVLLGVGVAVGTLAIGGSLAVLVSFYDFPGRRWLDWALVLPLAVPAYVLVFVLVGQFGYANPLQSSLFGAGLQLPGLRGPLGAICALTAVLYPYVYVLGRSAFLGQSRRSIDAARSLGRSYGQAVRGIALPLARPALAAGAALAVMEALADFGAVNLLGYQTLTDAIYRVWYGAFDESAALQLASVLVGLALLMVVLERLLRGRARYDQALSRGDAVIPLRLRGWRAGAATAAPVALLVLVFGIPLLQLVAWSAETVLAGRVADRLGEAVTSTLLLAVAAALLAVVTSLAVVYGQRIAPSRLGAVASRIASVGYAVPGTVVAVAVYVPLVWLDRRLIAGADNLFGIDIGLLFTGSILGLVGAYVIRFHAQAFFSLESRMGRIHPHLDDAARALGADRARLLAEVHVPLLWPGVLTAALLVAVEVIKELPATALLRPLGRDTLAVLTWEATKDARFDTAALPALLIVLVGLIPVVMLIRLRNRDGVRPPVGPGAG